MSSSFLHTGRHIIRKTLFLCLSLLFFHTLGIAEERNALVIGNAEYKDAPLRNPVNDARDVAIALEECGFTVLRAINADRAGMRQVIRAFGSRIQSGGVGLFYYAGHGIQVKGENYLVPIGAKVSTEDEVEDECLNASAVLRKMETAGNRLNIIILDACRNNPFGRSFRSFSRGLAQMDAPAGSILAYATAPGSVAADGTGRNGLFTSNLLKKMKEPGLEIGLLFRKVRSEVMSASDGKQVPWESSSLTGSFYFILSENEKPVILPDKTKPETPDVPLKGKDDYPTDSGKYSDPGPAEPMRPLVPESPEISADNTASPAGGNRWDWTVFILASSDVLGQINCVEYTLHPTFPDPVRTVCQQGSPDQAFAISSNGWGTFTIHIRVIMKNGQIKKLEHRLCFR